MDANRTLTDKGTTARVFRRVEFATYLAIFVCIFLLNVGVISIILWQRKKKRVQCHLYIVSLAFADLLTGAVAIASFAIFAVFNQAPVLGVTNQDSRAELSMTNQDSRAELIVTNHDSHDFGVTNHDSHDLDVSPICIFATTVTWTFILESLNHLTMISIDRMVAVVYPIKYRVYIQTSAVWWCIGVVWFVSLLEGVLYGLAGFAKHLSVSEIVTDTGRGFHFYMWLRFTVALLIILPNYILIVFSHRNHIRKISPNLSSSNTSGSGRNQSIESTKGTAISAQDVLRRRNEAAAAKKTWKLARSSLFAVLGVTMCFLPCMVYHFCESINLMIHFDSTYHQFAFLMIAVNSAINPFIYTNCVPELKQIWLKVYEIVKKTARPQQ